MTQPEELKKNEPLLWSPGRGTDVWEMFCACVRGDLPTVTRLVTKEPALARCNYAYRTPLYFAVRENQIAVVDFLLDHGPDLGLAVNDSPLEIANDRNYHRMEALLKAKLESVFNISQKGEPVASAIRNHHPDQVRRLLEASPGLLEMGDLRGNQPIHWAVMTRQIPVIDALIAMGADLNARTFDGARPIQLVNGDYHYRGWRDVPNEITATPVDILGYLRSRGAYVDICTAAYYGDIERVRDLLKADASLANRTSDYVTYYPGSGSPLRNAAARGHMNIVQLLLDNGADPNLPEEGVAPRGHALYSAVYNGHYDVARLLLEQGAYPSPPVESSADALSIALSRADEKMVALLCSYGSAQSVDLLCHYGDIKTLAAVFAANPRLADDPATFGGAAGGGHEAIVRLMLRYQPDLPRRVGGAAKTPELTEWLFTQGMNANHRDWLEATPLHHLARTGDVANASVFLKHGADHDARDDDICSTPLGWAAKFGQLEMVKLLLNAGAPPSLPEAPSWAHPLAWAVRRGHTAIAQLLK